MVLVFDLDETLYDELTYVTSGLKVVAGYVEEEFNYP
jgi:putative hydrolase of the HAD superfamily